MSSGAVCRHLKIEGRMAFFTISPGYQPAPAKVATHPYRGILGACAGTFSIGATRSAEELMTATRAARTPDW